MYAESSANRCRLSIGSAPNDYFDVGYTDRLSRGGATFISGAMGLMQRDAAFAPQTFTRTPEGGAVGYKQDKSYYYVHDHLGSVVGVLTAAGTYSGGYSYSPYGETRASATTLAVVSNVVRYIGGHQDSANLYKLGARYYDAAQGRFTQMDPSGQEKNPYAYGENDPIGQLDPSGYNVIYFIEVIADYFGYVDLGLAIESGDSQQVAIEITKIGVGTLTGVTCACLIAGSATLSAGLGALAGGAICLVAREAISNAPVGLK